VAWVAAMTRFLDWLRASNEMAYEWYDRKYKKQMNQKASYMKKQEATDP
jgi:hypothetical protein